MPKEINYPWIIRNPQPSDFLAMQNLCSEVYPFSSPWNLEQLKSHQSLFSEGQLLAINPADNSLVGMAFSLIVNWDDYTSKDSWKDFTDKGMFSNHNPQNGRTLYGAEVMVSPKFRGQKVGKALYQARRNLVKKLKLLRIRAGARMRGYSTYKEEYTPEQYLKRVANFELYDPTVSFQLKEDFKILAAVPDYLLLDPESLGFAALIEWLNPEVATEDYYKYQVLEFKKNILDLS